MAPQSENFTWVVAVAEDQHTDILIAIYIFFFKRGIITGSEQKFPTDADVSELNDCKEIADRQTDGRWK